MEQFNAFLQKFPPTGELRKPTETIVNQFKDRLPTEWLDFWKMHGFGNYANGLLKVIDPNDYANNLYTWLGGENPTRIPILITGFGNLLYYRKLTDTDNDVCLLDIHYRRTATCAFSFDDFMRFITDDEVIESLLEKPLFEQAIEKWGIPEENEIFYFAPALALGGSESIEFIHKGDATVHQQLLFRL